MPSGAKKRKAAKKKMVKEANNANYSAHSHGDADLKHHDEKKSDCGEASSLASQDHHSHQHPLTEGEEEEVEDNSSVGSYVNEKKSMEGNNYDGESTQKAATVEKGVAQIDLELKSEEDFNSKEFHDGDSSGSSSSSSSDDESLVLQQKTVLVETAPPVVFASPVDYLSEVVTPVNGIILVGEANNLVVETASVVDSYKVSVLEQAVQVYETASVHSSMTSGLVESSLKENAEQKSQKKEDEVVSRPDVNVAVSLDAKDSGAQVNEDKLLLSFKAPTADASNSAEHVKDYETPECSDRQPLVAAAPRTVQTTSWKSCCGMFELFTGSNR